MRKYRYRILMDGNGKFLVCRDRAGWFARLFPAYTDMPVLAHRTTTRVNATRGGLNPSPEPSFVTLDTGWYHWAVRDPREDRVKTYLFDEAAEAIKVLHALKEEDRKKQQERELTVLVEEK